MDRIVDGLHARFRSRAHRGLDRAVAQVYQLLADRRSLHRSALWATSNWLFDAASRWVFLAAFGWYADPVNLLIGYGLANIVGAIPLSPGGLGMVEGVLIPSLIGFGAPSSTALLGVVSWRLFEFWVPIPVAGLCYLSLRTRTAETTTASDEPGPSSPASPDNDTTSPCIRRMVLVSAEGAGKVLQPAFDTERV